MSETPETSPGPASGQDIMLELWLPPQLSDRMQKVSDYVKVSPMVFLRKSLDLHRAHRTGSDEGLSAYPDRDHLKAAYDRFQNNGVAQMLYADEVAIFLEQYELASNVSRAQGKDPTETAGFMNAKPMIPANLHHYISERLFPVREPGYYHSPQEFAIAATCELIWVYTIADVMPSARSEQP